MPTLSRPEIKTRSSWSSTRCHCSYRTIPDLCCGESWLCSQGNLQLGEAHQWQSSRRFTEDILRCTNGSEWFPTFSVFGNNCSSILERICAAPRPWVQPIQYAGGGFVARVWAWGLEIPFYTPHSPVVCCWKGFRQVCYWAGQEVSHSTMMFCPLTHACG